MLHKLVYTHLFDSVDILLDQFKEKSKVSLRTRHKTDRIFYCVKSAVQLFEVWTCVNDPYHITISIQNLIFLQWNSLACIKLEKEHVFPNVLLFIENFVN